MRALILSDVHANLEALEAALEAAGVGQESYDAIWNLGDVVGYGGSPNETAQRIREIATGHVRGNHDKVCCGLESALGFNPVARQAAQWTAEVLTAENNEWLRALPHGPVAIEEASVTLSHGSPLDEDLYILNIRDAWSALQQMQTHITFFGHTHVQGGFQWRDGAWGEFRPQYTTPNEAVSWSMELQADMHYLLNPGSIGQPRDGDWRAAFAVLDTEAQVITFHRVPYDLGRAQGRILMADLPERLAARLREGR